MSRGWRLAVGLACLGGVLALTNVLLDYSRTGTLKYGKIALAFGIPLVFYAIARSSSAVQGRD